MSELKYSKDHEWVRVEGEIATIGISEYAQEQLGDVVYVELPEVGKTLIQFGEAAVVESVKAASEIYAPVGGEVASINETLADDPSKVNSSPTGEGWFIRIKMRDAAELDELMDQTAYAEYVKGLE